MKKRFIVGVIMALAATTVCASDIYAPVLEQIETNSPALAALRSQAEAGRLSVRTGLAPDNPEVEFAYLWGSPRGVDNELHISVRQSFDFPTAYIHRNRIASIEAEGAGWQYRAQRMELLSDARKKCIELIYCNAMLAMQAKRLDHAQQTNRAYAEMSGRGAANIIESNDAAINLVSAQADYSRLELERDILLAGLRRLNGGKDIDFTVAEFPVEPLPADFDRWYAEAEERNPALAYVRSQVEAGKKQVGLSRAMGLPKLSAGYLSEKASPSQDRLRGVSVGISVPLWENRNQVRHAKVEAMTRELILEDSKAQFYADLQSLYLRAAGLQQHAEAMRRALQTYGNCELLEKALGSGEISLIEYLAGMEYQFSAQGRMLEAQRDAALAVAELTAVEL